MEDLRDDVKALDARVQRVHEKQSASVASQATILSSIVGVLQLAAGGVFETRFRFPEEQEREMQVDEASFSIATGFADGVTERLYGDGESQSRGHAEATEEGTSRPQGTSRHWSEC